MREVLGVNDVSKGVVITPNASGQILATADMHGALMTVVRSRCVSRVGLEGIVVRDTRFTFDLITKNNVIKSIPKEHTIFRFEVPLLSNEGEPPKKPLTFDINAEQFQTRAADRANKKFRIHYQPDI